MSTMSSSMTGRPSTVLELVRGGSLADLIDLVGGAFVWLHWNGKLDPCADPERPPSRAA
jgi:hypothetical protein